MKRNWVGILFFIWLMGVRVSVFGQATETMLQQIAALQGYIGTAEKGYRIAEQGIATVRDIKNGEFNLHSAFFSSLGVVDPAVKNMSQVAEIVALQISMVDGFSRSLTAWRQSPWLHSDELGLAGQVYSNLVNTALKDVNALLALTTDGDLLMSDGERIRRITMLDEEVKGQVGAVQELTDRMNWLVSQRQGEAAEINTLQMIYGLF